MTTASTANAFESPPAGETIESGPVLAVYAHPDDETLLAGGVLALAVRRRRRVVVVTATRGEMGEMIGSPDLEGDADAVAGIRVQELGDALSLLGVQEHHFLDHLPAAAPQRWSDSGMAWIKPHLAGPSPNAPSSALSLGDLEVQAATLARYIRDLKPSLVLCDEPGGSYGHPDHVRSHELTMRAVDLAAAVPAGDGEPEGVQGDVDSAAEAFEVPVVAWVVRDVERLAAADREILAAITSEEAMSERGELLVVPIDAAPASIAREPGEISIELDVTPVLPQVLAASRAYRSQVQGARIPVLDAGRPLTLLRTDQAAVGWLAMSNGMAQPIVPVACLTVAKGNVSDLGLGPDVRATPSISRGRHVSALEAQPTPTAVGPLLGGPMPSAGRMAAIAGCLGIGLVTGALTTVVHRWRPWEMTFGDSQPWGVPLGFALAFLTIVVAGLLVRALARGAGLFGYAIGVVASVQALAFVGRGGDVIVPGDTLGLAWLLGSVVAIGVAAFLPQRLVGTGR